MAQRPIGPYQIERRLATGGMAEVFVAKRMGPHGFEKRVALKRILPQYARDPEFVAMFVDEARLAATLEHPNVVQVFDFGELGGDLFLAMELVNGTNVNRLLRAVSSRGTAVPLDVALHIASQTASALEYAHRSCSPDGRHLGFVHRDVSPANVLLTTTGHVKLTDFGIATVAERTRNTDDGHVRGKLGYMSPEQVMGRALNGKSDVFTLTTVLTELLLAEPLFGTGSELDVLLRIRDVDLSVLDRSDRRIPRDVDRLIRSGLSRSHEDRPTAGAFSSACDEIIRRRGMGNGTDRLARLLSRLDLVSGPPDAAEETGGANTSFLDTTMVRVQTDDLIGDIGVTSPEIYRVRTASGKEIGPISFPRLVQLFTSGVVNSASLVAKEGGGYEIATALPELTRFVTSPGLQWRLDELRNARHTGTLGAAKLLPIFFRLTQAQETGVLHLWNKQRRKKIYLLEGRPEFVASTDRHELLGEYLVAHEMCMRMEIEMALALLPRYGGRLGDALVGLGILRPVELFRAISEQVRARMVEAFRWRSGHWAFVPDERSHEETFPIEYDAYSLIRDAALQAHTEELEAALAPVREITLHPVPHPPANLSMFRLPDTWNRLLRSVTGRTTFAATLARETSSGGVDPDDVYRAFYLGLCCQLIRAD